MSMDEADERARGLLAVKQLEKRGTTGINHIPPPPSGWKPQQMISSGSATVPGYDAEQKQAYKPADQSEMLWPSESGRMRSRRPPPNAWFRFWWRFLLGVKWRDLRPENKLDDLRRLG